MEESDYDGLTYPDKVGLKFDKEKLNDPIDFFFDYVFPDIIGKNILYWADVK